MKRQALTPERAVEGFADRVVNRFPGPTEVEQHAMPVSQWSRAVEVNAVPLSHGLVDGEGR